MKRQSLCQKQNEPSRVSYWNEMHELHYCTNRGHNNGLTIIMIDISKLKSQGELGKPSPKS